MYFWLFIYLSKKSVPLSLDPIMKGELPSFYAILHGEQMNMRSKLKKKEKRKKIVI